MKIFANKSIWKKLMLVLLLIVLVSFAVPQPVEAAIGGELMKPICSFLVAIGDGVVNIIHKIIIKQNVSLISYDQNENNNWLKVVVGVGLGIACFAVVILATGGVGAIAAYIGAETIQLLTVASAVGSILVSTVAGVAVGVVAYNMADFSDEIDFPVYSITPEELFKNQVPLFSVNFFNTNDEAYSSPYAALTEWVAPSMEVIASAYDSGMTVSESDVEGEVNEELKEHDKTLNKNELSIEYIKENGVVVHTEENITYYEITRGLNKGTYSISTLTYTSNSSINYTITVAYSEEYGSYYGEDGVYDLGYSISSVVSNWYWVLLIISVVGMLSVLVYIGIRILIASSSSQKAKYKQLLGDWLVGMVLLFTMHYIMIFSNIFIENLTEMFSAIESPTYACIVTGTESEINSIAETLTEYGFTATSDPNEDNILYFYQVNDGDNSYIQWNTNLMGTLRFNLKYHTEDSTQFIGYTVMFIVMIIYLLMFLWVYIKRVVYMAFLTIIAPIVALTYPIDKANDGSAQGFNYWFKEYVFNLLLQPVHLILYTILIGSAIQLATENVIYAIVAIGFMVPAEKILRTIFNFNKASTPGVFGGVAGAALTMSGLKWLTGHRPHDDKAKGGGAGGNEASDSIKEKITASGDDTVNPDRTKSVLLGGSSDTDNGDSGGFFRRGNSGDTEDDEFGGVHRSGQEYTNDELDRLGSDGNSGDTGNRGRYERGTGRSRDKKTKRKLKLLRRATRASFDKYISGQRQRYIRKAKTYRPMRRLAKVAAGATVGAASTIVSLASGVASGDASKTAQYIAVGLAGGSKLGSSAAGSLVNSIGVDGVGDAFRREYIGEEEYKRRRIEENRRNRILDENTIDAISQTFKTGRMESKERAEDMIPYWAENGIDDNKEAIAREKTAEALYEQKIAAIGQNAARQVKRENKAEEEYREEVRRARKSAMDKARKEQREELFKESRDEVAAGLTLSGRYGISSTLDDDKANDRIAKLQRDEHATPEEARRMYRTIQNIALLHDKTNS